MSFLEEDFKELQAICDFVNTNNDALPPLSLYNLNDLQKAGTRTEINPGLFIPTAAEAIRILRNLRQRFEPTDTKRPLVERMRVEVRQRKRPERNMPLKSLASTSREIAEIGGREFFSKFQIEGWQKVLKALNQIQSKQPTALAITAPTGAGKTEVFLLPLIRQIFSVLVQNSNTIIPPRFIIIYPRVALAQDQIIRTLQYVEKAQQLAGQKLKKPIVIGLQFSGIWSQRTNTLNDQKVFKYNGSNHEFLLLDECPWCSKRLHLNFRADFDFTYLFCPSCKKEVCVSLSKDDHNEMKPHLLLTTAESLDKIYLDWDFKYYLPLIHGIVLDEAHLFNQVYGTHIHRLLLRVRNLIISRSNHDVAFIASSATIADTANFAQRLFFGSSVNRPNIDTIDAKDFPQTLSGLETLYFLQAPSAQFGHSKSLSTMIQTIMATGHGILKDNRRLVVFAESLDIAGRLRTQMFDAESTKKLWNLRIDLKIPLLMFNGRSCPQTSPLLCNDIYMKGECWRGIIGGCQCWQAVPGLRANPLAIQIITGNTQGQRAFKEPVIIGTSALEVGIDDATVQATLHYRPPRTVFDFIQRRGRAGRKEGDSAYTIVVLGKKPSDYYYLTRRHRLIDGEYEIPLNPDNVVIKLVHEWLEKAREEAFSLIQQCKEQQGIWRWIFSKFNNCSIIRNRYELQLDTISQHSDRQKRQELLKDWIESEREAARKLIGVEWEIPKRKLEISTPQLLLIMDKLVNSFKEWLSGNTNDTDCLKELAEIRKDAAIFIAQPPSDSQFAALLANEFKTVHLSIGEVETLVQKGRSKAQINFTDGKAWFEFFTRLEALFEKNNLIVLSGAIKVVYQALYLLHQDLAPHTCSSNIPVYIPENYFGSIRPIRVELPGNQITNEPITSLATLFAPYHVGYRYEERSLYTLETQSVGTLRNDQIKLRPAVNGPQSKDPNGRLVIQAKGIRVQKLQGDALQNISMCQSCMQLYDLRRHNMMCRCGGHIQAGKVYPEKNYIDCGFQKENLEPISSTFTLLPSLKSWTTIRGANVSFRPQNGPQRIFRAWLNPALYYELPTTGIQWSIAGQPSKDQLNTAANLLHKTIASVVGVREDKLAHNYDENAKTVLVWETSEGGAGLSDVFADTLQKNPLQVYLEMVATVACPIYLAEEYPELCRRQTNLVLFLADQFKLPQSELLLEEIAVEAQAEAKYKEEVEVCRKYDGCPACIQSSQVGEKEQPKRSLAWQLVQSLVQAIPDAQWTTATSTIPGPDIWFDQRRGLHHVLVL